MEQVIPIEECAKQRLQALVYAYSLLIKHLREEGVDREIVKRASDKVWAVLGQQAAEELKPVLGETINLEALQQAGAIAEAVHGIEANQKMTENQLQTEFVNCPWQEANTPACPMFWSSAPRSGRIFHLSFSDFCRKQPTSRRFTRENCGERQQRRPWKWCRRPASRFIIRTRHPLLPKWKPYTMRTNRSPVFLTSFKGSGKENNARKSQKNDR